MLYKVLPDLFEKGLLSQTVKANGDISSPRIRKGSWKKSSRSSNCWKKNYPSFVCFCAPRRASPKIVFYEGMKVSKKLYMDNLRERQPILEFVSLEKIHPEIEFHSKITISPRASKPEYSDQNHRERRNRIKVTPAQNRLVCSARSENHQPRKISHSA